MWNFLQSEKYYKNHNFRNFSEIWKSPQILILGPGFWGGVRKHPAAIPDLGGLTQDSTVYRTGVGSKTDRGYPSRHPLTFSPKHSHRKIHLLKCTHLWILGRQNTPTDFPGGGISPGDISTDFRFCGICSFVFFEKKIIYFYKLYLRYISYLYL